MEASGISSSSRSKNSPSPSSERFISLFSRSQPETINGGESVLSEVDDDLDEDEVFWTGDFSQSNQTSPSSSSSSSYRVNRNQNQNQQGVTSFRRPENFGILAALPEEDEKKRTKSDRPFVYRKSVVSSQSPSTSSRMIRTIPKHQSPSNRDYSLSLPAGKLHQSAPVNVPVLSKVIRERKETVLEVDDEDADDEEMLPPHEIVARGSSNRSPRTTFSVLEGVGRTLKGRDLRQVRNAVWRQTGFLD